MKKISFLFVTAALIFASLYFKHDTNAYKQSMKPQHAKAKLEDRIKQAGSTASALTLDQGVRLMLDFYRDIRAQGVNLDESGDMLLFQWGTYDWDGTGSTFQCDITRQFIKVGVDGDDGITQLSLTFHYKSSPDFDKVSNGNKWCGLPNELNKFEKYIADSEAFKAVLKTKPLRVEINYGGV